MAIWQYEFHVIPKASIIDRYSHFVRKITDDEFNFFNWFEGWNKGTFIDSITYLAKKQNHWDKNAEFFGEYEGDSVEVSSNKSGVYDIFMRIDLRTDYINMAKYMEKSINDNNLIIITIDFDVFEPKSGILLSRIKKDRFFR